MKLCGLRRTNARCLTQIITGTIFTLLLIPIVHRIIVYRNFAQSYPFSTVPFWEDNRAIYKKPLMPVMKVDDVNLSNATVVIASCCRNVRKKLVGFQRNVQIITALFGNYRIYLFESDSLDGTLEFLNKWQKNDSDHVRIHTKGQLRWRVFSSRLKETKQIDSS